MTATVTAPPTSLLPKAPARAERTEAGRAQRGVVSRRAHASCEVPARDAVSILRAQDATRLAGLVPTRYERMLASPWTFLRGAASIMATDLAAGPSTDLYVHLCGDAHLSNFGVFAAADRRLLFDVNDFDETHPGPFEWDLKRLAASAVVCGRTSGHAEADARRAATSAVETYRRTLAGLASTDTLDAWYFRIEFEQVLDDLRSGSVAKVAR